MGRKRERVGPSNMENPVSQAVERDKNILAVGKCKISYSYCVPRILLSSQTVKKALYTPEGLQVFLKDYSD